MRGNQVKTISQGTTYPALLGPFQFMLHCSVGPSQCETKFTSKHLGMGYVKMHGFYGNPLYDFRELGVGLQI